MIPRPEQQPRPPIRLSTLLAVEGNDTMFFLEAFLTALGLSEKIELWNFMGNQNLTSQLRFLQADPGFSRVVSLGILRDAERNPASSAFDSICQSLERVGLSRPPRLGIKSDGMPTVSVYVLPDGQSPGMLETLCWTAVADDPAVACVESYLQCLEKIGLSSRNLPKAQVGAFLASREKPNLRLGEAASAGHFRFDSNAYRPLKDYLLSL